MITTSFFIKGKTIKKNNKKKAFRYLNILEAPASREIFSRGGDIHIFKESTFLASNLVNQSAHSLPSLKV